MGENRIVPGRLAQYVHDELRKEPIKTLNVRPVVGDRMPASRPAAGS